MMGLRRRPYCFALRVRLCNIGNSVEGAPERLAVPERGSPSSGP